jgi:hypothetical protein
MASRLTTRLAKLENSSGCGQLSEDAQRLLVQLLARLDAIFWPFRTHEGSYRAEVRRIQREYLSGVGGLRAASQGESNWKAGHYTRNELIGASLVTAHVDGGQVTGLRLTAQGIADARAMVGDRLHPLHSQGPQIVRELLRRHQGEWVRENDLFGPDACVGDNPSTWDHLTEYVLPLLREGLVESNSDLWRRVYYRAVDGAEIPSEPPSGLTEQPWADGLYVSAFDSERAALRRLECSDGGIAIPHRCT